MALTITGTLIIDETLGLQNATAGGSDITGNDVKAGLGFITTGVAAFDTLLNAVVVQDLTGVNVTVAVSNGTSADLDGSSMLSGFGANVTDLAFTNSAGGPLLGEEALSAPGVSLLTVDGAKIFLYSYTGTDLGIDENNVVFGRKGVWNGSEYVADPSGDVVFAAYLQPTDASGAVQTSDLNAVGSKVWLVQYEEIKHPDTTNHDDALSLFNLNVTVSNRSDFSLQGAPSGQNLFLMYGDGTPSATDAVIIVTGKNPVNQSDPNAPAITSGDTVNTGQGGGPTTLGTNSQQIVEGTGLYFTFAMGANTNFTVPNLDQNEADVEANIDFTSLYGTNGASFSVVQSASGDKSTLEISAYTTPFNPGTAFIENLQNNTPVAVTKVTITTQPTGHGKNAVPGETLVFDKGSIGTTPTTLSGITVTFSANTVVIKGLEANDLIAYNTVVPHNRVLIDNIGSTDTNFDAPFDIGGFALVNSNSTPNPFSALTFQDDGPSISTTGTEPTATVDETVLATDATADFSVNFTSAFGTDGAGTLAYALGVSSVGAVSGLTDTATNNGVFLFLEGGVVVGREGASAALAAGGAIVFTASVNSATGVVTLDQQRAIVHPVAGSTAAAHDDNKTLAADTLITLTATKTDQDGDTATATLNIAQNLNFEDDGPSISTTGTEPTATVDETVLATNATADFSVNFTSAFGADGAGTLAYALGVSSVGAVSGLTDTATNNGVFLFLEGGVVVGREGASAALAAGGAIVFTASVNSATGVVTLDQQRAIVHPVAGSTAADHDDNKTLAADTLITLTATKTDKDGDTASATLNIAQNLNFEDDGPSISTTGTEPSATVDETVLATNATADFSVNFTSAFGADGAGTLAYALGVSSVGAVSGLTDTATNNGVFLFLESGVVVGREGATAALAASGAIVFTLSVNSATGVVTLDQQRAIVHPVAGSTAAAHDDNMTLAADTLITLTATKTDKDGDTATATLNIAQNLNFEDDGPSISTTGTEPSATVDETVLATNATADFSVNFTSAFGADGAGTLAYALGVSSVGAVSGLTDTATNNGVFLFLEGGVVVGREGASAALAAGGAIVFTVSVNSTTGVVTLDQQRAIVHPVAGSTAAAHDDNMTLAADTLITLTATKTDKDGDTASATLNIAQNLNFEDDGPAVSANATVLLDDDALTGGNPGGSGDDADLTNLSGTLGHTFGQDGAGTVAYLTSGAPTGFTYVADGTSLLVKQGTTTVLTLTMVAATGAYTVAQNNPILHAAGLTENNQAFTINYRVTDGDGDTADGTLSINVDDDTPVVTAKSNLVYANTSNEPPVSDIGGTGVFAYSIGADKHVAPYSASNTDLSVTLTSGTVGANAISTSPAPSVSWVSETDSLAVFNVGFTYVSNPASGATTNATGTLTFDKVADTYTLKLDQEIASFSILNTSTPDNPLQGYALNLATTVGSNPPVSVMELASNFFVQFEGFGVINGTPQTFAYDTSTGLFTNDRRYVTVSSSSIGAASDTLQSDEVIDLDFFTENPKGFVTLVDPDNPVNPRATSKAIFIEFTQAGPGAGKDMVVVLKLVDDDNPANTINRTFIVGNSTGNDDVFNANLPAYGFVAQAQNGIVVFESNDYNFSGENYSIQGAQVVTSTQGASGTGYQLNGAIDDPTTQASEGATVGPQIAFGGATTEGNNEPIKIVNIGFVTSTTPDAHLTFNVVVTDADGDATAAQTLDVTIVGDNGVTASANADTFVIGDTDVDGLLSIVMTTIDGGFAPGTDTLDFSAAGSLANYEEEVLTPANNLAEFTAAADIQLDGTTDYYFGVVGGDGYLAQDSDGAGITNIIKLVGVTDMASTDIV